MVAGRRCTGRSEGQAESPLVHGPSAAPASRRAGAYRHGVNDLDLRGTCQSGKRGVLVTVQVGPARQPSAHELNMVIGSSGVLHPASASDASLRLQQTLHPQVPEQSPDDHQV